VNALDTRAMRNTSRRRPMTEDLDTIVTRLERTANELRSGELTTERAAALVDDCARLASQAGSELDRRVRIGDQPLGPAGQLALSAA
jgi:hypothetical protein